MCAQTDNGFPQWDMRPLIMILSCMNFIGSIWVKKYLPQEDGTEQRWWSLDHCYACQQTAIRIRYCLPKWYIGPMVGRFNSGCGLSTTSKFACTDILSKELSCNCFCDDNSQLVTMKTKPFVFNRGENWHFSGKSDCLGLSKHCNQ